MVLFPYTHNTKVKEGRNRHENDTLTYNANVTFIKISFILGSSVIVF
jgi:hypothetical protein